MICLIEQFCERRDHGNQKHGPSDDSCIFSDRQFDKFFVNYRVLFLLYCFAPRGQCCLVCMEWRTINRQDPQCERKVRTNGRKARLIANTQYVAVTTQSVFCVFGLNACHLSIASTTAPHTLGKRQRQLTLPKGAPSVTSRCQYTTEQSA